jgi:CheY-like chemotaxis protein
MRKVFRIVVADDDLDDHELMAKGLKDCKVKIEVSAVYNGQQLMDYLLKRNAYKNNNESPDLVLLDLNMPLMDGFEALQQIRANENLKAIPLYVITTSKSDQEKSRALSFGANGYFCKGSSSSDIVRVMREICRECFEDARIKPPSKENRDDEPRSSI